MCKKSTINEWVTTNTIPKIMRTNRRKAKTATREITPKARENGIGRRLHQRNNKIQLKIQTERLTIGVSIMPPGPFMTSKRPAMQDSVRISR